MKFCEFWAKCWNPSQLFKKNGTENAIQRPNSREEVIDWYKTTQRPKNIGFNQDKTICDWFHGKHMAHDMGYDMGFLKFYRICSYIEFQMYFRSEKP